MGAKVFDDFPWKTYTVDDYGPQHEEIEKTYSLLVSNLESKSATSLDGLSELMPGVRELYRSIIDLDAVRILEVGAGSGLNLINLSQLLPDRNFFGVELLESQVKLGKSTFKDLFPESRIIVSDFINDYKSDPNSFELVFTNAVVMHLSKGKAIKMIEKMINISGKFVLLHENIESSHNYRSILEKIQKKSKIEYKISPIADSSGGIITIKKLV
jgi:SAM-dependent methyltransferase